MVNVLSLFQKAAMIQHFEGLSEKQKLFISGDGNEYVGLVVTSPASGNRQPRDDESGRFR
jgi:hypothetical protein